MIQKRPVIGVMGAHDNEWYEYAHPLGQYIAHAGYHLLTGGGGGVMTSVAKAYTEIEPRKGVAIGILPVESEENPITDEEYPNPYIEIPIVTPLRSKALNDQMPYSRNVLNILSSTAVVALPGWHGTKNEVSIALHLNRPIILFGPDDALETFPEAAGRADSLEDVKSFIDDVIENNS